MVVAVPTSILVALLLGFGTTVTPAVPHCSSDTPALASALADVDTLLAVHRATEEIPGLAAGVVCQDELVWAVGYGVMAVDDPRPVTPETRFRIASITKLFTATAVAKLQDDGALDLRDPVQEHLPWFSMGRPAGTGTSPVTIWHVLTHTGGLPRDSRLTDFGRLFQPHRESAIEALPSQNLASSPGAQYAYSNLGYAILGEIIQSVSGITYAEYIKKEILNPLEMWTTVVHPTRATSTAWGHGPRRSGHPREKAGFWDLKFATPAGGMAASVNDLSRFVVLQLAPYGGRPSTILTPESLMEMHRLQFVVDPARGGSGLGWGVETSNHQHLVYHGGELPDQSAYVLIDLKQEIGVIILTNAEGVDVGKLADEGLRLVRQAIRD